MWVFLTFLLVFITLASQWRQRRLKQILEGLIESVEERRPVVISRDIELWRYARLDRLAGACRELIQENALAAQAETDRMQQVETTLSSIREAVFILDSQNRIFLSNEVARQFFGNDLILLNQRIETVLRHSKLLDFIRQIREGSEVRFQEFEFPRRHDTLWFEVSGNLMKGPIGENGNPAPLLLVLHDISRLKNLERIRRDFIANVSHELRTPLTIIKGFTETLVEDHEALPPESRERFLHKIQKNVERLHLLVEDLLTLSRLESNPDQFSPRPTSLHALLREIADNFRERFADGGHRLELDLVEGGDDTVMMDAPKMTQVIENLLDNALRYAGPSTMVSLRTSRIEFSQLLRCTVADNGIGIPEKDLDRIFQRFYRVEKGRSREKGGTGLGLSIAKHIVHLHKGEIWAESQPGKGLQIHFTLPLS